MEKDPLLYLLIKRITYKLDGFFEILTHPKFSFIAKFVLVMFY